MFSNEVKTACIQKYLVHVMLVGIFFLFYFFMLQVHLEMEGLIHLFLSELKTKNFKASLVHLGTIIY